MRTIFKKMFLLGVSLMTLCTCAIASDWYTDYDEGLAQAKKENRNMMILFTGSDWCGWCKKLQAEILTKEEFTKYAQENLVLIEQDFPKANKPSKEVQAKRQALAKKYSIRGYPTIVLLTPEEKDFGRMGYMRDGPSGFIAKYKTLAEKVSTPTVVQAATAENSSGIVLGSISDLKMEGWMKAMQALCKEWYPILIEELNSPDFKPYSKVTLSLKSNPKGVAGTSKDSIILSQEYFSQHGTDVGAVVHELVHVVQAYPNYVPWITEGIADYIRLYKFEPNSTKPTLDAEKATVKAGYKETAVFLAWLVENKDPQTISKLNTSLRKGEYSDEVFKTIYGKTLDELFAEFLQTLKK